MKTTVTLNKAIVVKGKEVTEISLDFNRITGSDLLKAEKDSRALGDQSPSVFLSMTFQAVIAAKLIGVPPDDIMALPATDFRNIVFPVANFLLS